MRYFFAGYALDAISRELRREGTIIDVTPQVFDLLVYLIRNRDRVVSKDDLIAEIWNGRIISESALTTLLNVARHAIGDSGNEQRVIKTLPRKGYRFVAIVREDAGSGAPAVPQSPPRTLYSLLPRIGHPSIAVMPFVTISGNDGREFLAEGIAEDLITELAKLHWLLIVGQKSSWACKQGMSVGKGANELGVHYVLEGSVQEMAKHFRVTGRLIDATSDVLLWVGRYDRGSAEIHALHDDITEAMASGIKIAILNAERQRVMRKEPRDLEAWEAYQRGMWHMSRCEPTEHALAQTFFQRAIDFDPTFAAGHGALGWSYMMAASIYSQMTIAEGCMRAEPLVRKATELDENDPDSGARLAIASLLHGDLEGAFAGAQQVLSTNENCAEALGVKGTALLYSGRCREGREAIERHLRLSPRDPARPIRLSQIAASHYLEGNFVAAMASARHVIRQYPKHPTAYRWLAASLGQLNRVGEAEEALNTLQTIFPSSFEMYIRQRPRYCNIEHAPMLAGLRKAGWRE